jgi:hypothetical protein
MKRRFLVVAWSIFACIELQAQNPILVQKVAVHGAQDNTSTRKDIPLPNAVLNHNLVVVGFQSDDGTSPTVSDDQGNTYTVLVNQDDGGHSQSVVLAFHADTTNSPQTIKITSTSMHAVTAMVWEYRNVATSNPQNDCGITATEACQASTTLSSSTSPSPGSMTTHTNNDLIISYCAQDSVDVPFATTVPVVASFASGGGGALDKADLEYGDVAESQVQPTAGSVNQGFTSGTSLDWICVQGGFKAASAGTAPTVTPRVISVMHQSLEVNVNYAEESSWSVQIPIHNGGTVLYAATIHLQEIISITDNHSNTWTATGDTLSGQSGGLVRGFYAKSPTLDGDLKLTLNLTSCSCVGPPGGDIFLFETTGLDTTATLVNGRIVHATATGSDDTTPTFTGASVTPHASGGLIFSFISAANHGSGTPDLISGVSPQRFLSSTDPVDEIHTWPNDNNNGWAIYKNPNTSTVTSTWSVSSTQLGWEEISDAWDPAP